MPHRKPITRTRKKRGSGSAATCPRSRPRSTDQARTWRLRSSRSCSPIGRAARPRTTPTPKRSRHGPPVCRPSRPTPMRAQSQTAQSAGATTDEERTQRLFAWVRDTIGYCAIEIGEGGWRPHAASVVLSGHYGDCKDKAHLLQTLLAALGVSSQMVVINADFSWQPTRTIDGLPHFNHAILLVHLPSGDRFADPTDRTAPFGELPLSDQHAPYLVQQAQGGQVQTTPEAEAAHNQRELELVLAPKDGDLIGKAHWTLSGAQAAFTRAWLGTSDHAQGRAQPRGALLLLGMHAAHVARVNRADVSRRARAGTIRARMCCVSPSCCRVICPSSRRENANRQSSCRCARHWTSV